MNNFTYRSNEEKDNLEAILRRRKRKFNTQQWVARIIMIVILVSVVLYVTNRVYYTTFDGYVHVDENKVRAPFDIYLDSIYVHTGDIVYPGDTLYSYYAINTLIERNNPYSEAEVVTNSRDMQIKRQNAVREASVLKVRIAELKKQIETENHNISLGLSSNSHKLDLERTLSEAEARLRSLWSEISMYDRMLKSLPTDIIESMSTGSGSQSLIFDNINAMMLYNGIAYNICADSSIITDIKAPDRTILFQKEEILTAQHLDLEGNNLCIIAYIPVDKMHRITLDTKAEVVVNSEFSFTATVTALGLRTDEIPENLRSYFAKKNQALIARLEIDPGQSLPFWCLASGLPVDVRIKNSDTWGVETHDKKYLWYVTGQGVSKGFPGYTESPTHKMSFVADTIPSDTIPTDSLNLSADSIPSNSL